MPDRDPIREYQAINQELAFFSPELGSKRQIIVINKADLPAVRENLPKILPWFEQRGLQVFIISSVTGEGIPPLLDQIASLLWSPAESPEAE
jgi:GTP-binding protein